MKEAIICASDDANFKMRGAFGPKMDNCVVPENFVECLGRISLKILVSDMEWLR